MKTKYMDKLKQLSQMGFNDEIARAEELALRMDGIRAEAERAGRRGDAVRLQMHASIVVRPSGAEAREFADELAAARSGPPPEIEPVNPEDYLDHVPGGSRGS